MQVYSFTQATTSVQQCSSTQAGQGSSTSWEAEQISTFGRGVASASGP
ncbi:Hypothetical protein A7982_07864 [Minicystis rosea]|nr:Hypothetical protein A7982_07864 [Minicystis rosea]